MKYLLFTIALLLTGCNDITASDETNRGQQIIYIEDTYVFHDSPKPLELMRLHITPETIDRTLVISPFKVAPMPNNYDDQKVTGFIEIQHSGNLVYRRKFATYGKNGISMTDMLAVKILQEYADHDLVVVATIETTDYDFGGVVIDDAPQLVQVF